MQADWAVELEPDDETLDLPWAAPQGGPRYFDLKQNPELIAQLPEVTSTPELAEFLMAINSRSGIFQTAKCDVWTTTELTVEDEIFAAPTKFGGYIDIVFANVVIAGESPRLSFPRHEQLAKRLVQLLHAMPEIAASAEFLVRRCHYHAHGESEAGFYITCYTFGFGGFEQQARASWTIALQLVQNLLLQTT